jgi:orotate phosphoribosyltransferase-like protein
MAANIYRPNAELVRLHQRIVGLQQEGLSRREIMERVYLSRNAVNYHLRGNCNCKNGKREAVEAAAGTSGAAQA